MLENQTSQITCESALVDNNLYQKVIPEGVDSLMRSVSDALYFTSVYASQIRSMCASYLQHLLETDSLPLKLKVFQKNKTLLHEYIENPNWSGFDKINFELISLIFTARITIYTIQDDILHATYINRNLKKRSIDLLYSKEKQHYDTVYPTKFIEDITNCQEIVFDLLGAALNMNIKRQKRFVNLQFEQWFLQRLNNLSSKKRNQRSYSEQSSSSSSNGSKGGCGGGSDQKSIDLDTRKDQLSSFFHNNNLTFFQQPIKQENNFEGPQTTQTGMKNVAKKNYFFNDFLLMDSGVKSENTQGKKGFDFSSMEIIGDASPQGAKQPIKIAENCVSSSSSNIPPGLQFNLPSVSPAIKSPFSIQSEGGGGGFFNFSMAHAPEATTPQKFPATYSNLELAQQSPNQHNKDAAATTCAQKGFQKSDISPVFFCQTTPPGLNIKPNNNSEKFNFRQHSQFQPSSNSLQSSGPPSSLSQKKFQNAQESTRKPIILDESKMQFTGKLQFFDESQSYGFIVMDSDASDIFVHMDDLNRAGVTLQMLRSFQIGKPLQFRFCTMMYIGKYNQSQKAVDIQLVTE